MPVGQSLTRPDGPVVTSEKTLRALTAIRRHKLLPTLYGQVAIGLSNYDAVRGALAEVEPAAGGPVVVDGDKGYTVAPGVPWLFVVADRPEQALPARVDFPQASTASEAATLRIALAIPASLVLLDGPIKERAKLSFIKAEGTLSILVNAFRQGHLSAVPPMVKALEKLGHADVLPPKEMLEALWKALEKLEEA